MIICRILQETYVIKDCFAIDNATLLDHNDSIWDSPNKITRGDEYSTITIASGTRLVYMDLDLTQDRTIEFDMNTDNAKAQFCNFRQDTTPISGLTMQNLGLGADEFYHIKIEINGDSALVSNSTNSQTYTMSLTGANRFSLRAYNNTIKFKNFIYY